MSIFPREKRKKPFVFDSKEPDWGLFKEFLKREVPYSSPYKQFPPETDELAEASLRAAKYRHNSYIRQAAADWICETEDVKGEPVEA